MDDQWLKQAGIGFSAAPGCNAIAVVEYVFSSLLMLAERDGFALKDRTVGIVGVGNVGGRLQKRLEAWASALCCAIRRVRITAMRAISARWMSWSTSATSSPSIRRSLKKGRTRLCTWPTKS